MAVLLLTSCSAQKAQTAGAPPPVPVSVATATQDSLPVYEYTQADAVRGLLAERPELEVGPTLKDAGGHPRVVTAKRRRD